jgi:hypothetical protein
MVLFIAPEPHIIDKLLTATDSELPGCVGVMLAPVNSGCAISLLTAPDRTHFTSLKYSSGEPTIS